MNGRIWVVVRLSWDFVSEWRMTHGRYAWWRKGEDRQAGPPCRAFADHAAVLAWRDEQQRRAWRELPPFLFADPPCQIFNCDSSLSEPEFVERIRRMGFVPPAANADGTIVDWAWLRWWDDIADQLTPQQREDIWRLFDKLDLYTVVEVDLED